MSNDSPIVSPGSLREELEILFEEASALGNRLKKNARNLHRNDNLSASGRILLQTLQHHGPQTVPQLAAVRSTSRQNIQVLVDRLEAAGYIAFQTNPNHKRSELVTLTDAGRRLLSSANQREAGLLANLLPHTTEAEVLAAAQLLRKLRSMLGGEHKRRSKRAEVHDTGERKPSPPRLTEPAKTVEVVEDEELPVNLL
jgi:DNA-binding MarR family transcriptional regulator